ncbi:MAG: tRNA (guanosine(37)-N1)-methyltransferase TrmD [Negativicutes bacterium]|nr:tRNA (guanosine(37)-N1)-methyltransferase TrmD [Negativicutes bacterium]
MRIDILTLFPEMFEGPLHTSILERAQKKGLVEIVLHQLRAYSLEKHHQVDEYPFGGGVGMLMRPEPVFAAWQSLCAALTQPPYLIYLSPSGKQLQQTDLQRLAQKPQIALLCGHYEGIDQRIIDQLADEELSIGDYVLTGGELPAMVLTDGLVRLLPGVLGHDESSDDESFRDGLLEYPQYTRPAVYEGAGVPAILLQGNHQKIAVWRRKQSLLKTWRVRPDLLAKARLDREDRILLAEILAESNLSYKTLSIAPLVNKDDL